MISLIRRLLGQKPAAPKEIPVTRSSKNWDDLTEYELDRVGNGNCPDCDSGKLLEGPRGGMSVNLKCGACGSEFNSVPGIFGERISDPSPGLTKNKQADG